MKLSSLARSLRRRATPGLRGEAEVAVSSQVIHYTPCGVGASQPPPAALAAPRHIPLCGNTTGLYDRIRSSSLYPRGNLSLGLLATRDGRLVVADGRAVDSRICPSLCSLLKESLRESGAHFQWTSVQVNVNVDPEWHDDALNIGVSLVGSLGTYRGGKLEIQGLGPFCIKAKAVLFDASIPHRAQAYSGVRVSFIAYQHPLRDEASKEIKAQLKALGCCLDDPHAWVPPRRCSLDLEAIKSGRALYIGRGGRGGAPAPSIWGNPI